MNVFSQGLNGVFINGQPAGSGYFQADCGDHFDDYVRANRSRPFDYNQFNGGYTEHNDIWVGRKLRIKMHKDAQVWREAEVVSWKEYLMGPFSPAALWNVSVRFVAEEDDEFEYDFGDVVTINGLKNAQKHNGKVACVVGALEKGRYGVKYGNEPLLGVKPANLSLRREVEFRLVRCNVQGGGTLEDEGSPAGCGKRLSFEWLEEAVPEYIVDKPENDDDHPINVAKQIRRDANLANIPGPTIDSMRQEIDDALQLPLATHRMDPAYLQRMSSLIQSFEEDSLETFHTKLSLLPLEVLGPPSFAQSVVYLLDCEKGELFVQLYDELKGTEEYEKFVKDILVESKAHGQGSRRISGFKPPVEEMFENSMNPAETYHDGVMLMLTEKIAVEYEELGDYHAAISWYERNIECIPEHLRKHNSEIPEPAMRAYPSSLINLALAQKRAGLFQKALDNNNLAVQYGGDRHNLDKLLRELEMWKGTSVQLPKRLDE